MEIVPVVGHERQHEIEIDEGIAWVVSLNYGGSGLRTRLRPVLGRSGYQVVSLRGIRNPVRIHQLVCEAFHGKKPGPKFVVAHRNDIKTDNCPDNLYWATPKENAVDMIRNRPGPPIKYNHLTSDQVLAIRRDEKSSTREQAEEFHVHRRTIERIKSGKTWKHIS